MKLEKSKVYQVHHKRKGHFVAILIDIVDASPGDEQDEVFWTMRYDVRHGTDQAHLATQPKQRFRESNIRPSLVLEISEYVGEHWLREIAPLPVPIVEDKKNWFDRIFSRN